MAAIKGTHYELNGQRVKVTKVARRSSLSIQRTVWYRTVQSDGSFSVKARSTLESCFMAAAEPALIVIREAK